MITIPNITRLLLVQDSIFSMHALCFYVTNQRSFESKNFLLWEWKQVANIETIIRKVRQLYFIVQGNRVAVFAEMILLLTVVKVYYEECNEFDVINTSCEKDWSATTPFKDLPHAKMTTCRRKAMMKNIPLMSADSIKLVQRYI